MLRSMQALEPQLKERYRYYSVGIANGTIAHPKRRHPGEEEKWKVPARLRSPTSTVMPHTSTARNDSASVLEGRDVEPPVRVPSRQNEDIRIHQRLNDEAAQRGPVGSRPQRNAAEIQRVLRHNKHDLRQTSSEINGDRERSDSDRDGQYSSKSASAGAGADYEYIDHWQQVFDTARATVRRGRPAESEHYDSDVEASRVEPLGAMSPSFRA